MRITNYDMSVRMPKSGTQSPVDAPPSADGLADWDRSLVRAATTGKGSVAKIHWHPKGGSGSSAGLKLRSCDRNGGAPALGGLVQGLRKLPKTS